MKRVLVTLICILIVAVAPCPRAAWALEFNEGSDILEVDHCRQLDLVDAVTLEAWIKPGRLPGGGARIIDKSQAGTSTGYMIDTYPGNSLRMIVAEAQLGYNAKLPSDRWSHVVGVFSRPDGVFKLGMPADGYLGGSQ